ncbi:MAG: hypothetical protein WAP23_01065 [Candidatus Spechtbacterales bacterium]
MIDKISNYKFIIPPIVAILCLASANFSETLKFMANSASGGITDVVSSVVFIFAVGFVISSLSYFLVNIFGLYAFPQEKKSDNCLVNILKFFKLPKLFKFLLKEDATEREVRQWVESGFPRKDARSRADRRWDIAMTNANSATGVAITIVFVKFYLDINVGDAWPLVWLGVWSGLITVFMYNFSKTRSDVNIIENHVKEFKERK